MDAVKPNIIRSNRRTISIQINSQGQVVVRAPSRASDRDISKVLTEKNDWIQKTLQKMSSKSPQIKLITNQYIYIQGGKFSITFDPEKTTATFKTDSFVLPSKGYRDDHLHSYIKQKFFPHLKAKVVKFAQQMEVDSKISKIRLSKATTNWGSCNSKGTISLNWKLACLPKGLQDYIIIHELSHLDHMNHSPAFWSRVERFFPDYKLAKKKLKQFSLK